MLTCTHHGMDMQNLNLLALWHAKTPSDTHQKGSIKRHRLTCCPRQCLQAPPSCTTAMPGRLSTGTGSRLSTAQATRQQSGMPSRVPSYQHQVAASSCSTSAGSKAGPPQQQLGRQGAAPGRRLGLPLCPGCQQHQQHQQHLQQHQFPRWLVLGWQ